MITANLMWYVAQHLIVLHTHDQDPLGPVRHVQALARRRHTSFRGGYVYSSNGKYAQAHIL
jgi:hypothetical protein